MCVICVYQLYLHKSKKLYIISSLIVQNLLMLSVVLLKLDKLSPKLFLYDSNKNVLKRN